MALKAKRNPRLSCARGVDVAPRDDAGPDIGGPTAADGDAGVAGDA